ncbi:LamG-like jellyroll fold domain-containing protein [Aquimarina rubra]|uniref:LamG-like jellyroll fold domain-containing protein n=1 Tax=Aquimarina rubra TaxID=1920033 RepID=A0ABW5L8Y9_9FLAO
MKKITIILMGLITLISCSNDDDCNNDPMITVESFEAVVIENPSEGQPIGTVNATANNGASLVFSLDNQSVANALEIDAVTGELSVLSTSAFDHDVNGTITATYSASSGTHTREAGITITVSLPVPENDLLAYYSFNGNAKDESIGTTDGVPSGVSFGLDRFQNANAAAVFNQFGAFVDLDDQDFFVGQDQQFAISTWVKPNNFPTDTRNQITIIGKLSQTTATTPCGEFEQEFFTQLTNEGKVRVVYYEKDGTINRPYRWIESVNGVNEDQWAHIAINYDGSIDTNDGKDRIDILIDGVSSPTTMVEKAGDVPTEILDTTSHLSIGNFLDSSGEVCHNRAFEGTIDDMAIYSRLLTVEEITNLASDN